MENGFENSTDLELQQKVIEGIKSQFSHPVTRIEGFLLVQVGANNSPYPIHLSYKETSNGHYQSRLPASSSASSLVYSSSPSPSPSKTFGSGSSRKVNRRKAYMPMKCEGGTSPPPAHATSPASLLPRSLALPSAGPDDAPLPLSTTAPSNSLAVDADAMGPLNADAIQASMSQVMPPSLPVFPMGPFSTDIHLPPMTFVNSVIPVPQMMGDSSASASASPAGPKQRLGKMPEQRKIKPKPISSAGPGLAATSAPYTKPTGGSKRNPNKEFACNQCTEKFKSLNLLTEHTTAVHKCFRCTTCNSKFTQRSNLQRHSLKHLGFKPFKCAICLKEYYRKDHLVRHIEVSHPGSEPKSSILNVMPSSDCLRILEETQAEALRARLAAQANDESGPDTPSAPKLLDDSAEGSPVDSQSVANGAGISEPKDLSIRAEVDAGGDDDEEDAEILFGMEIVDDLIDEDDLEDDLEDLEMDLNEDMEEEVEDEQGLAEETKGLANGGDTAMITLPNPSS